MSRVANFLMSISIGLSVVFVVAGLTLAARGLVIWHFVGLLAFGFVGWLVHWRYKLDPELPVRSFE